MSMTPDERKAWACERLERHLRENEAHEIRAELLEAMMENEERYEERFEGIERDLTILDETVRDLEQNVDRSLDAMQEQITELESAAS